MEERWRTLKPGDRVRLICVPEADLKQREHEIANGAEMAGLTADTLERIIATDPIVTITNVDEWGMPWFERNLVESNGEIHYHSLGIAEDESWELVE
jgi:hypothetical protein